ncbi:hypothetical protein SAMN05216466_106145 [Paraburkholderia phenazinium]|uniref:Uncharacterized protein n=1 Tax=Paraburkholderia phenazinium TaxID=60549 RepID=A0A1G7YDI5_9BURK|nr:hypothetical protein [Paraburkholderia phenazinium]SDG94612.1 hypothetical protein SAMN05216466_106145 [Paraburkholderia phenazinium]
MLITTTTTTHAQRDAFDREVRYALRHDVRTARALLTYGPQEYGAPERFMSFTSAIRQNRHAAKAVAMLLDLGAPASRTLRKVPVIPMDCLAVLLKHTTPAMLNGLDGYYEPLWLATFRNAEHPVNSSEAAVLTKSYATILDQLEAAGADVTWPGLARVFTNEEDLEFFKGALASGRFVGRFGSDALSARLTHNTVRLEQHELRAPAAEAQASSKPVARTKSRKRL